MKYLVNIDSKDRSSGDEFNFLYNFSQLYRNVTSIELVSAEIPLLFTSIRQGLNTFQVAIGSNSPLTVTLPSGNYDVTTLLNLIQSLINPLQSSGSISVSANEVTNKILIISPVQITIYPTALSRLLGFSTVQTGTTILANGSYVLDYDLYLNIWFKNVSSSLTSYQLSTFKLPVSSPNGYVFYYLKNSGLPLYAQTNKETMFSYLEVQVLDRFNNSLSNNGADWSMTLEITCD